MRRIPEVKATDTDNGKRKILRIMVNVRQQKRISKAEEEATFKAEISTPNGHRQGIKEIENSGVE
eukprot:10725336-Heterocapsa_arctica.AAC.1